MTPISDLFRPGSSLSWERFWCPRGGSVALDWSGFLRDPMDYVLSELQPELVRFEAFEPMPCVVLLGEPGMGKSHELRRRFNPARDGADGVLFRNLRQYDSTLAIQDDIFRCDQFLVWAGGDGTLTLTLDSLDEALIEAGVVASWLTEQLKRYPTDRLRLRIACRTAQWPQVMESGLEEIWGKANVRVFELAPLTAADVRLAADAGGVDQAAFFADVARREVSALANKPTTLRFLLNAFARHQALPHNKTELYRLGCLQLCEEDEERRASGHDGSLTPDERLAVARRIAAATVFGNRAAVWRGRDPTDAPSAEIPFVDLVGGSEPFGGGNRLRITDRELKETLDTGLFSGRGEISLGWGHQTYAEFLASRWIIEHDLALPQIESLIRHPHDADRRFIPQLRETISWLAGMHPGVRTIVLTTDPELLLDSDIERLDDEDRAALIDALLDATARARLRWPEFGSVRRYERLAHPELAEQLRTYVCDRTCAADVRELALEIAGAAGAAALQGECADIALDSSEPLAVRMEAARVVAAVGDAETRARLRPLALELQEEDEDDDLKGTALRAVWPDYLSVEELFASLTFPKRANRSGSYDVFLSRLAVNLDPSLLPAGLRWAAKAVESLSVRGHLGTAIIRAGWEHLDRPDVLAQFADFAAGRLANYHDLLSYDENRAMAASLAAHPDRRRRLVEALVEKMGPNIERLSYQFIHSTQPLVVREDVDWVLDRAASCEATDSHGPAWARLLRSLVDVRDPSDFERLYAHRDRPYIAASFSHYWRAIALDSDAAEALRREHEEFERRHSQPIRSETLADLPSAERVLSLLAGGSVESENSAPGEAWFAVAQELTRSEDGRVYNLQEQADQGPTWRLLDEAERLRVIEAAAQYLRVRAASVEEWTADGGLTMGAWAGDRALRLLEAYAPDQFALLPRSVWVSWAPVIVKERPSSSDEGATIRHKALLARAYAAAPMEVIAAARQLLLAENEKNGGLWSLESFEPLWDEPFAAAMLTLAEDPGLTPQSFRALLEILLERNVPGARPYAESLLTIPLPRAATRRRRALAAAAALLLKAPAEGWPVLQPILRRPGKFRRDLALSTAHRFLPLDLFSEDQLADIFAWLTVEFPFPDPWYVGVYSPSPEDEARRWRSDVMRALEARATPAAADALERLRQRFPDLGWISQTILRTRESVRRETWAAPGVRQILALAENAERRLVETGDQLLEVLVESLGRLQDELQGELPSVSGLWDNLGRRQYRPKDEQELTDMIARHFRRDVRDRGVVASREVVIRRGGAGGAPGQRTDVYVTAVREDGPGRWATVAAIVEVKGSWHDDLLNAMETQLADDYLARNPECRHGLYLAGWYLCQRWRDEPGKRKTRRHGSASALRDALSAQAASLSTGERTVRAFVLDVGWH